MRYTAILSLISAALSTTLSVAAPSASNPTIDSLLPEQVFPELEAIVTSAESNAPALQMHAFYTEEAQERFAQANARRYPNAKLYTNLGPREEYRSGGAEDSSTFAANAGIHLYQPLYHWGAIEASIEQARLENQNTEIDFSIKRSDLIRNLRADYLNLHLTEQAYRKELRKQTITNEKIKRSELQFQSGKINAIELRSIQLESEQSLLRSERVLSQKELITKRFKNTYGWHQPLVIAPAIPAVDTVKALAWLKNEKESLKLSSVYEFASIQKQLNALRYHEEQQTIIGASNRPLINLFVSGTQGRTNTSTTNDVNTLSVTAGINVSWNIFDGFRTKHQKIEATLKKRRLEAQLEKSAQDLILEQQRILESITFQFRELSLLEQEYAIQLEQYAEAEQSLASGRITQPQLQDAQLELDTLEQKLSQSRADALMGISDYQTFTQVASALE